MSADSRVLLLCTEGATDPEAYARLTAADVTVRAATWTCCASAA